MKVISTSDARKHLSALVNAVHFSNKPIAIGRRQKAEVLLIKFPEHANHQLDAITNMNQFGGAFDFLDDEPDLYTHEDLIESYV